MRTRISPWLLLIACTGAVSTPVSGLEAVPEEARPTFRVEEMDLHVGKVPAGAEAVGTFVFHNDGDEPVEIIRAKPS